MHSGMLEFLGMHFLWSIPKFRGAGGERAQAGVSVTSARAVWGVCNVGARARAGLSRAVAAVTVRLQGRCCCLLLPGKCSTPARSRLTSVLCGNVQVFAAAQGFMGDDKPSARHVSEQTKQANKQMCILSTDATLDASAARPMCSHNEHHPRAAHANRRYPPRRTQLEARRARPSCAAR